MVNRSKTDLGSSLLALLTLANGLSSPVSSIHMFLLFWTLEFSKENNVLDLGIFILFVLYMLLFYWVYVYEFNDVILLLGSCKNVVFQFVFVTQHITRFQILRFQYKKLKTNSKTPFLQKSQEQYHIEKTVIDVCVPWQSITNKDYNTK